MSLGLWFSSRLGTGTGSSLGSGRRDQHGLLGSVRRDHLSIGDTGRDQFSPGTKGWDTGRDQFGLGRDHFSLGTMGHDPGWDQHGLAACGHARWPGRWHGLVVCRGPGSLL